VSAVERYENMEEVTCPFEDCDWSQEYIDDEHGRHLKEANAEQHYQEEHAGKARVQVVVEKEALVGDRDAHDLADAAYDELEDDVPGYEVAYSRTEIIDEPSDHSEVDQ